MWHCSSILANGENIILHSKHDIVIPLIFYPDMRNLHKRSYHCSSSYLLISMSFSHLHNFSHPMCPWDWLWFNKQSCSSYLFFSMSFSDIHSFSHVSMGLIVDCTNHKSVWHSLNWTSYHVCEIRPSILKRLSHFNLMTSPYHDIHEHTYTHIQHDHLKISCFVQPPKENLQAVKETARLYNSFRSSCMIKTWHYTSPYRARKKLDTTSIGLFVNSYK